LSRILDHISKDFGLVRKSEKISNMEHFTIVLKRSCVCLLVKRENQIDLQWVESCKNQTTNEYNGEKEAELIG